MYRLAIIEDDGEQCAHLGRMVRASLAASSLSSVDEVVLASGERESERLAHALSADIVLLDINLGLPRDTGISLVQNALSPESTTQIIYVSGYLEYASDVYRTDHVWFLSKPVRQADLDRALRRAIDNLTAIAAAPLIVKAKGSLVRIVPARIVYIESDRRKVTVIERDRVTETYAKISELQDMLPASFVRCHKSFLVNMNHIAELTPKNVVLSDGTSIPVSQRCRKELQERFLRYAGRVV